MSYNCPDIASKTKTSLPSPLEKVGMSHIQIPLNLNLPQSKTVMQMGEADAYVNLVDPNAKGIHMSRLFIKLQEELESSPLSLVLLEKILAEFLESHNELSDTAFLNIRYNHPIKQTSLTTNKSSWRSYPVSYECSFDKERSFSVQLRFDVLYSSTCPCSAALSRQAMQEKFKSDFNEKFENSEGLQPKRILDWLGESKNITATPHSQRSKATIKINHNTNKDFNIESLIQCVESSLKTPVQSIVKRGDEKEFAKLNGQNLMFAEDAARKIKASLETTEFSSFTVKVSHYESLHAHNAVAYASS